MLSGSDVFAEKYKKISDQNIPLQNESAKTAEEGNSIKCSVLYNERQYHFFGNEVFEEEFFLPFVSVDDYIFLKNNPFLGTYFLMIIPASSWLDEESLYILEIL